MTFRRRPPTPSSAFAKLLRKQEPVDCVVRGAPIADGWKEEDEEEEEEVETRLPTVRSLCVSLVGPTAVDVCSRVVVGC